MGFSSAEACLDYLRQREAMDKAGVLPSMRETMKVICGGFVTQDKLVKMRKRHPVMFAQPLAFGGPADRQDAFAGAE